MDRRSRSSIFVVSSFILVLGLPVAKASAQTTPGMELIDEYISMEAERAGSSRQQIETSASNDASSTLVQHSSVSDFIGIAGNLSGLQVEDDDEKANSASATVTAYALVRSVSPLIDAKKGDEAYNDFNSRMLRNVSLTIGYDHPKDDDLGRAEIYGFKWRILGDARSSKVFNKRLPAKILAKPATAFFRPGSFDWNINKLKADEKAAVEHLLAYERGASEAGDSWGDAVCGKTIGSVTPSWDDSAPAADSGSAETPDVLARFHPLNPAWLESEKAPNGRAEILVQQFFPPSKRLGDAARRAIPYLTSLLCENDGRGSFRYVRRMGTGLSPVPQGMQNTEADFSALVEDAFRARAMEAEFRGTVVPQALIDLRARAEILRVYVDTDGALTEFGRAVGLWTLGRTSEAYEALAAYIDSVGKNLPTEKAVTRMKEDAGLLVQEINKRTEIALTGEAKRRDEGGDSYNATLVLEASPLKNCLTYTSTDCNYFRYLNVTANFGFDYVEDRDGKDDLGGDFALEVSLPVVFSTVVSDKEFSPNIDATRLPTLSLSGRAEWLNDRKDKYVGQLKFAYPIADGVTIPLSIAVANRTELVDETDVRGLVGFTFDTSLFSSAFKKSALAP